MSIPETIGAYSRIATSSNSISLWKSKPTQMRRMLIVMCVAHETAVKCLSRLVHTLTSSVFSAI